MKRFWPMLVVALVGATVLSASIMTGITNRRMFDGQQQKNKPIIAETPGLLEENFTAPLGDEACKGVERWSVKTLQDSSVDRIKFDSVTDITVRELVNMPKPKRLPPNSRINPVEFTFYRVHALFLGYKHEKDLDFHMVIADMQDKNITMVAEVPASHCANVSFTKQFDDVRRFLLSQVGRPRGSGKMFWMPAPVPVVITGIGFYDKLHGQTGLAKNGIELHPVFNIEAAK